MIQSLWQALPAALALAPAAAGLPAGLFSGGSAAPATATEALLQPWTVPQEGAAVPPPPPGYQWELHPVPQAPDPAPPQAGLVLPQAPPGYTWVLLPTEQAPAAARGAVPPAGVPAPGVQGAPQPVVVQQPATGGPSAYPPPPTYASSWTAPADSSPGSFHVFFGGRDLDQDFWGPLDDQRLIGVEGHFSPAGLGPFELELGTQISGDEQNDVYLSIGEFYGGLRLPLVPRRPGGFTLRPYVGGGLTYLHADLEDDFIDGDDDGTGGWYARGGLEFVFDQDWSFTIDYRYIGGTDVDLTGFGVGSTDGDIDGGQLTLGFGFYL